TKLGIAAMPMLSIGGKQTAYGNSMQRRPRGSTSSVVELLGLAVNVVGAEIGRRVLRQHLLGAIGLLHRVFFLAIGKRFLGQRQRRHAHLVVAAKIGRASCRAGWAWL